MKRWHTGKADEAWKVMICARDAQMAIDAMNMLYLVLGHATEAELRKMSGDQIVSQMKAFIDSQQESVRMGLKDGR